MNRFLFSILIVLIFIGCQQKSDHQGIAFSTYDQFLSEQVRSGHAVGVHGFVFQDGKVVYEKTYGLRDREAADSMHGDELYFLQSMTKPIVSVALMTLYEEGKFQLDDPVSKYLPEFKSEQVVNDPTKGSTSGTHPATTEMTIRQLLSHTSGMTHGIAPIAYDKEIWNKIILDTTIKTVGNRVSALAKMPLMFDPGSRWAYSFSPDVVARLIEVLSGKTVAEYLQEKIFDPLGMKETGYNLTEAQQRRVMSVYAFGADSTLHRVEKQPRMIGNTIFAGVNALFASTKDYLTFAAMLLNNGEWNGKRIVKPETMALMTTDQTTALKTKLDTTDIYTPLVNGLVRDSLGSLNLEPGYGFGLGFAMLQDPVMVGRKDIAKGEFFWGGANSTFFFVNPGKKLIGIFMTQVASVGVPNPYHFYFCDQMRKTIYEDVK
ncbi:MAG: serine hydrolase domain-containing protein [Chitinophagaceae bacterium]